MAVHQFSSSKTARISRVIVAAALLSVPAAMLARASSYSKSSPEPVPQQPHLVENDEIKVVVPPGWTMSEGDAISAPMAQLGPRVQMSKNGYTLSLAYHAAPKANAAEGRFNEIFAVPWLQPDEAVGCSFYLRRKRQVITETLVLVNLVFSAADQGMSKNCGVPAEAGSRWFAGFFSNASGGFFLRSRGAGCGEKAYALTYEAKTASELPKVDDAKLMEITAEAGRIVASIQYKRCPLAPGP